MAPPALPLVRVYSNDGEDLIGTVSPVSHSSIQLKEINGILGVYADPVDYGEGVDWGDCLIDLSEYAGLTTAMGGTTADVPLDTDLATSTSATSGTPYFVVPLAPSTDLTDTYWKFSDAPTLSDLGEKSVNFTSGGVDYTSLTVGSSGIYYGSTLAYGEGQWGGTDLTGTTWQINEVPTAAGVDPAGQQMLLYETLNLTSNNENYTWIAFDFTKNGNLNMISYQSFSEAVWESGEGWSNNAYRTLSISGGSAATNSDLISWLQNNATLISW